MRTIPAIIVLFCLTGVAFAQLPPFPVPIPVQEGPFDLDTGRIEQHVVESIIPYIYSDVSATAGDAPLVLRFTMVLLTAMFDATAPYHPTAVGNYSRIANRPADEATPRNVGTAVLYASQHGLLSLLPHRADVIRSLLTRAGLDPDDRTMDPTTAVGIGNIAGIMAVRGRINDGMNQDGTEVSEVNPRPFADYTGYRPVNTPDLLLDPSRWQPDIQVQGIGLYKAQQFVTPQYALVEPYADFDPTEYSVPPPTSSDYRNFAAYKQQADEVLRISAVLDDEMKMKAELFDDKLRSLGFSTIFTSRSNGMSSTEFIQFDLVQNMATFDAGIFVWQEKRKHDAVRPFSAIRHIYGSTPVEAWGGPGQGTQTIPANRWRSYLEEADHPEYPSASACFCAAHAQAGRLWMQSDALGFPVMVPPGASRQEPGVTPAEPLTIVFPTWTDFSEDCGQSRVWAGVHFQAAVDESQRMCAVFGDRAYEYVKSLVDGTAAPRGPSLGR